MCAARNASVEPNAPAQSYEAEPVAIDVRYMGAANRPNGRQVSEDRHCDVDAALNAGAAYFVVLIPFVLRVLKRPSVCAPLVPNVASTENDGRYAASDAAASMVTSEVMATLMRLRIEYPIDERYCERPRSSARGHRCLAGKLSAGGDRR
jgi:hypothetical protein